MSNKMYGSFQNRIEEGHVFTDDKMIHEGDDITMYLYTDRHCYYVTKVVDQKHIFVKPYYICADHSVEGLDYGHDSWKYFKSKIEMDVFINHYFPDHQIATEEPDNEEEWVYRRNKWMRASEVTPERVDRYIQKRVEMAAARGMNLDFDEEKEAHISNFGKREAKRLREGRSCMLYYELSGKVSFGRRDYCYDWEF